jgi:hypothetical protein
MGALPNAWRCNAPEQSRHGPIGSSRLRRGVHFRGGASGSPAASQSRTWPLCRAAAR